jgi:predicted aspartyl protease
MGLFRTTIEIRNWERQGSWRALADTLVDTGSEYTWIPRQVLEDLGVIPQRKQGFIVADGRRIDRDVGYAPVRVAGSEAPDLVVFAEAGDMNLLGAHSLAGLNLKIDPVRKELVPAGPVIAAVGADSCAACRPLQTDAFLVHPMRRALQTDAFLADPMRRPL